MEQQAPLAQLDKYRLVACKWGEADALDWTVIGFPSYALLAPDGEVKFWPVPEQGLVIQKDDEGYFIDIRHLNAPSAA